MAKSSVGSTKTSEVRFRGMPQGSWRVVWHGDVGFHRSQVTWSQPTINVVLQREDQESSAPISASFAIAQLWALRLGSVWRDTELVPTEHWGEERELSFPVADVGHCVAGVPLTTEAGSDFLIPFGVFPHHRAHTRSQCLRVLVDDVHFILPAIEVIRFYFGSSGKLIKSLFSSRFAPDDLCSSHRISHGDATVELAPDVPRSSGVDIARIVFSDEALRAARSVGRSLVAASSDQRGGRHSTYAKAELPYLGTASLKVRGLPMTAEDGQSRFLVTEIVACSARFPWTNLNVIASLQGKGTGQVADGGTSESDVSKPATSIARRVPGNTIDPREASGKSGLRFQGYARGMRFTDLWNKPVNDIDSEQRQQVNMRSLPAAAFDSTGYGGGSSAEGRRVELFLEDGCDLNFVQSPVEEWSSFFDLIRALAKARWVQEVEYVQLPHEFYWHYASLPEISDADGVILPETIGDSLPGTKGRTPRRASFVNLTVRSASLAMISLSPRTVEPRQTIMVWPGARFDGARALRALHDGLTASGSHQRFDVPLPCLGQLTDHAYRTAAVALLRCARAWWRPPTSGVTIRQIRSVGAPSEG
jgi:hypothetical protein